MSQNNNFKPRFAPGFKKRTEHRLNELITHREVRVTGEGIESKVCSIEEALSISKSMGLDLVEMSSEANPPVCKIVDYGKFLYEKKKKEKDINSNNKSTTKEIKLGPHTQEHDLEFKSKHAINFLKRGDKVKVSMFFRGREIAFKTQGEVVMLKFLQMLQEAGKPEFMPKLEGKNLYCMVSPKATK